MSAVFLRWCISTGEQNRKKEQYQFINIHQRTKTARYCGSCGFGHIVSTTLYLDKIFCVKEMFVLHLLPAQKFHLRILLFGNDHRPDRTRWRKIFLHDAQMFLRIVMVAGQAHINRVLQHHKPIIDQGFSEVRIISPSFFCIHRQIKKYHQSHKSFSHPVHPQRKDHSGSVPATAATQHPCLQSHWSDS